MDNIKVVFVVYHDLSTEARSLEMLLALKSKFTNVKCVCRKKPEGNLSQGCISPVNKGHEYVRFLKIARKVIKDECPDLLVLHDEFTAQFIGLGKKIGSYIIYDSSELNVKRKLPGFKNKICKLLYIIERINIKKADLVFAANQERLEIMKRNMNINCQMEVFDNIHRIDDEYDSIECNKKYGNVINKYERVLVYGGGISHGRYTFKLIQDFSKEKDTGLLIVGSASKKCLLEFNSFLKEKGINNAHYLGFVSRGEFKYLLKNSYASFVLFQSDCPNTKFCASGKMYEGLFVGTPIICSDNPPLKRICKEYGIGESSNDFLKSFRKILANHSRYVRNVNAYVKLLNYEKRIDSLGDVIKQSFDKSRANTKM